MTGVVSILKKSCYPVPGAEGRAFSGFAAFLLLALTALLCTMPLLIHGTLLVSHDINVHVFQADQFFKSVSSGVLIPDWTIDANKGYGAANFEFYSPLAYYAVALIRLFLPSTVSSMIAAIWLSFFLSGAVMYVVAKRFASDTAGMICAILYQVFPYHIFDLYLRGTFAELFAFVWFPLFFLFLREIFEEENVAVSAAGLGISYAGLILTHLVSGYMFTFILFAASVILLFTSGRGKRVAAIAGSVLIGLGLSSFFLLPVIFERKFVQIDYIFEYIFSDYRKNFLFLSDNLHGAAGLFHVPVHVIVILEAALFIFLIVNKTSGKDRGILFNRFLCVLFAAAFLFATPLSKWAWDFLPGLKSIQFPWRWVAVMEVSLVFLLAGYLGNMNLRRLLSGSLANRLISYLVSVLAFVSVITIAGSGRPVSGSDMESILHPETAGYYTDLPKEYTPVWAFALEDVLKQPVPQRVSVLSGSAAASVLAWRPESRMIVVSASTPAVLRFATFYYPGWVAYLGTRRTNIEIERNTGAMLVSVPKGSHVLHLDFVDTPLRRFAKQLSLISIFILVAFAALTRIRKWKKG